MVRLAGKALGLEEPAFSEHLLLAQAQNDDAPFQSWGERLQGAVNALKEQAHPLIQRGLTALTNYASLQLPKVGQIGVNALNGEVSKEIKQEVTPRLDLRRVAAPWAMDYAKHGGNPGKDLDLQVGEGLGGQFMPKSMGGPTMTRDIVQSEPNATTLAHELGHSVNALTPEGRARQATYFRGQNLGSELTKVRGQALLNVEADPDSNPLPSIATGAAANLLDSSSLSQMKEEAMAWKRGQGYLQRAGIPLNKGLAAKAFSTYPGQIAVAGARQGALGWAYGQLVDKGLKGLRDGVIDPIHNYFNPELTPEEQALEKYGYNRQDYRIQNDWDKNNPEQGMHWKIEPRFFKKPR